MTTKSKSTKAETAAYDAVNAGKETVEQAVKATTEAATKGYEQLLSASQKNIDATVKNYDEFTAFGKDTVEAWMQAGNTTAKGIEALNAEMLAYAKAQVDDSVAATKAMFGSKTLQEAIETQAGFAKSYFDAYVSQSTKMGEMVAKTTQEAIEPINSRYAVAFEKWAKSAA